MTRATGPIINSRAAYREVVNDLVEEAAERIRYRIEQEVAASKIDFFKYLPVCADKIMTVLVRQDSAFSLAIELLPGEESKDPKPRRNRDRKWKPIAEVRLSPTGIKYWRKR